MPGITRNPRPNRGCFYCLLVLLDPVAGVEVLPEPTPEPLLAAPGVVGVLLAPPALLRWSRRQSSRSAPVRPTHLLASLLDDPVDALPEVPVSDEPVPVEDEPIDGELDEPVEDELVEGTVVLLSDEVPDEPAPVAPVDELPMLPEEAPVPLPALEPEDCAIAVPDNASRAAAVAAVRVFSII